MADECDHVAGILKVTPSDRLRGVPEDGLDVGASAPVPYVWPRWVLRQLAEPSRDEALPHHSASDHRGVRPTGRLGVVLRRRDHPRSRRSNDAAARADTAVRVRYRPRRMGPE